MIVKIEGQWKWDKAPVVTEDLLVIAGQGAGVSRLVLGNGQGLTFLGRELVIQDVDIELEAGVTSSGPDVALVVGSLAVGSASTGVVRVRLVRVRLFAYEGSGIVLNPGGAGIDASLEDVEIEAGMIGLFVLSSGGYRSERVVLRSGRIAAPRPIIAAGPGLALRGTRLQCTVTSSEPSSKPPTACIELTDRVEFVRLNRVDFEGLARSAVSLRLPGDEAPPSEDVQLTRVVSLASIPTLVKLLADGPVHGVHGLWMDFCTRLHVGGGGSSSASAGWALDEDAATLADAGVGRISGQYNRAGPGRIASRGGAGLEIEGAAARQASGLGADLLRATRDLLPGGVWVGLGGDGAVASVVQETVLDTVVGLVDVERVAVGSSGTVLFRALVPDVEPGTRAVFSVYLRTAAASQLVDARVYVSVNATTIGGSRLLRFRVRPYWQRFTASVAYMPEGGGALLPVVMLDPVAGGVGAEVLLAAPQFELGDTPTPPFHRDSEDMGGGFVPLQAFRLGNEPICYARNEGGVDPNAPLGRRTLNLEPKGGADVDGWVVTSQGVRGFNPLHTTPGVEECGPT